MGAKVDSPRLKRVAVRQWGVVTRRQLIALGLGARGIDDWAQSGRLIRLHRGVYAVGHDQLRIEGRWLGAVMACGPGARLSHRDGAHLWELRQSSSALIDVTVPSQNGRIQRAGIRIHRSRRLPPEEVTVRHGIPVTTVERTLLDLADVLDMQGLRRAVTEAEYRGLLDHATLIAVVENNPGRRGKKVLEAAEATPHRTRSPLEDRLLAFVDRYGVEEPDSGVWIGGYELDFVWTRVGLAVELDGHAAHTTRRAFSADRLRDRVLWRRGIRTMRLTDDAFDAEEEILADLVQAGVSVASWPRASSYSPPRRLRISSARAM